MADPSPAEVSRHVAQARDILRKKVPRPKAAEILALSRKLKKENAFGYARRLLRLARESSEPQTDARLSLQLAQEQALCTYKDPHLPVRNRLEGALRILDAADPLTESRDQETLGLAGAIFKRKWEVGGRKSHLEQSLYHYMRGYRLGAADDLGYTGINAAFILNQLADLEAAEAKRAAVESKAAGDRHNLAAEIRTALVETLPGLAETDTGLLRNYWFLVTVAEAFFGSADYQRAGTWLEKARANCDIPLWEMESTARQLATLARLQSGNDPQKVDPAAWTVLKQFLGGSAQGLRTAYLGKVGLALSGGGFRASLFHIGVLAKLAELDMLRHVEVLSCVSGGSIVGAHYYLKMRELFKRKSDAQIQRDDYVRIVQETCREFLAGVQTNIRTRVAAEFLTNIKMIFRPNYSRTMRAGELYEEKIYARIPDGEGKNPRWLNDLFIHPGDEADSFAPKRDNWRRSAKVPILILNATTLNTGHNWQFTASWMGEPPSSIDTAIDANYRLRRMYYHEAPPPHNRIRLGHAVAASACVPGLFEPIVLPRLYVRNPDPESEPDRAPSIEERPITVRLVDGGVHDNQGIMSLLEQDCNSVIVSDASGQMDSDDNPSKGILGVPLRSNSILMARVREAEYRELDARSQAGVLRNLLFIHLKKGLEVIPVNWIGCEDPPELSTDFLSNRAGETTPYGILKEVQENLAGIRTDLDSFCDQEAYALMTSGYRMAENGFKGTFEQFPLSTQAPPVWDFLAVEESMRDPSKSTEMLRLLSVCSRRAFKIWRLIPPLKMTGITLGVLALAFLLWACWKWSSVALVTLGTVGTTAAVLIAGAVVGKSVMRMVRYRETLAEIATGIAMSLAGWILARIHLHVFDRWYLRSGKINAPTKSPENDR
jgi:predicted acylesterase/phospholipase RssA